MRKVTVVNNVSLDGVMQAPGRPDEDTRGGFKHGGWAAEYNDEVKGSTMAKGMSKGGDLLFGRRTYEDFFKVWPGRKDNPSLPYSTTLRNMLPQRRCANRWRGKTRRCSTATRPTPSPNSSRARAATSLCSAAVSLCSR